MSNRPLIEMKIRNKDEAKTFIAYFETLGDLKRFTSFIEELIESVKKKTLEEKTKPCGEEKNEQ